MVSKAVAKYLRIAPRKMRGVMALVKGKDVSEAKGILSNTNKKSSTMLMKLLNSAIANAKRLPNLQEEDLYISDVFADGGPVFKRYRAEPMGRANVLRKKTSHITVVLEQREPKPVAAAKKKTKAVKGKAAPKVVKSKATDKSKHKLTKTAKKKTQEGVKSGT